MLQWKQRLYAFLLRRVLGPILDADSLQKLHESIDISIEEGKFAIRDVGLNTEYLSSKCRIPHASIRRARVSRLEIILSLEEHTESGSPSSLAWRAMKLGSQPASTTPSVALNAIIEIEGIYIELEPCAEFECGASAVQDTAATADQSKSMLSSYIEAALASLRVKAQLKDLKVRVCSGENPQKHSDWVELRLASASVHDMDVDRLALSAMGSATVMHKIVDIGKIVVATGSESCLNKSNPLTVALFDGTCRANLRLIECKVGGSNVDEDLRIQQDLDVTLHEKLNFSVNLHSLSLIRNVVSRFQMENKEMEGLSLEKHETPASTDLDVSGIDEADLTAIEGIMKQLHEARLLAEKNQVRGGILVPSEDGGSGDDITFDAFFDANDQSFYSYSVLRESIMMKEIRDDDKFVHTNIRMHSQQGGLKVVLDPNDEAKIRRCDEYILMTYSDVNVASSLSGSFSEHTITVGCFEIEKSSVRSSSDAGVRGSSIEIAPLLQFTQGTLSPYGDQCGSDVLVEAPCIEILFRSSNNGAGADRKVEMEISFDPLNFFYFGSTIDRVKQLLPILSGKVSSDEEDVCSESSKQTPVKSNLAVHFQCSSISTYLPVAEEKDFTKLFDGPGYEADVCVPVNTCLGLTIDFLEMDFNNSKLAPGERLRASCNHVLGFALTPLKLDSLFANASRRFDIFALSGRTELNSSLPISARLFATKLVGDDSHAKSMARFPEVPLISSFKARQEDEDEDTRVDSVLNSKFRDLEVVPRKELRGIDHQQSMAEEASKCDFVVDIDVATVAFDLSVSELESLVSMLDCVETSTKKEASASDLEQTHASRPFATPLIGIVLSVDILSLNIHYKVVSASEANQLFCFMMRLERFGSHLLLHGSDCRQARILSHGAEILEASNFDRAPQCHKRPSVEKRAEHVMHRCIRSLNSTVVPLLHRSHLFAPLSKHSPCILLDIIDMSNDASSSNQGFSHTNIHITLYDLTYRLDYDAQCLSRIFSIIPEGRKDEQPSPMKSTSSLTRIFVSIVDCNVDYTSSSRFRTASRTILRVGDLHVSGNLMFPRAAIQSLNFSAGDISVFLCCTRFPYNFENSRTQESESLFPARQTVLKSYQNSAEVTLREMNYRTVLSLDALDAVVAVTNKEITTLKDPQLKASLSIGELSMFACKDSFAVFLNTISEVTAELTALTDEHLANLKESATSIADGETFYDSVAGDVATTKGPQHRLSALDALKQQSALRPTAGTAKKATNAEFLLDGYDWTTVDPAYPHTKAIPPGEEQTARWYGTDGKTSLRDEIGYLAGLGTADDGTKTTKGPNIISHHFPIQQVLDPLSDEDMGIEKYAGVGSNPQVRSRLIVHDFSLKIRLFDGYDWPENLSSDRRAERRVGFFVIDDEIDEQAKKKAHDLKEELVAQEVKNSANKKSKLLDDLLCGATENQSTFAEIPLPEERGQRLREESQLQRLARRTGKYLQLSASGVKIRLDSLEESTRHRLSSCLSLNAQDFFMAETISSDIPIKMAGEWVNESEHPRETAAGLFMMKMVTWKPPVRVNSNNEIQNDEAEAAVKILPLRCILDQRAIRFARAFFRPEDDETTAVERGLPPGLHAVPPPLFRLFRVRPFKLKVDYKPQMIDTRALRDGAIVELINLSPLDDLVLTLQQVEIEGEIGFGAVASILVRRWVEDICSTQIHKFLTSTRPLEPITHVGGRAADMVVLPWEAFRNGESMQRALRAGATSFSRALVYEGLTLMSGAARLVARVSSSRSGGTLLPSRPVGVPRGITDTAPHAIESLSRGLQAANYKIVIVPYREYQRNGTTGAVRSVLKGIPVAIAAPASGVAEALSFTLVGARNQIRPDIRKEEEASLRGLLPDR